ncbi:serine hydrolase domain-containing protein [Streptomyces sp. NPDC058642]|uniref:serine hydrolase domain-containing protein n=1 Tax=Streptomyces sp. NPDC058642 TaxID=3346572 RepID=UPI0036622223
MSTTTRDERPDSCPDDGAEPGAGLSVWRDGREVVRLNAGWADAGRNRPWRADALVMPYSLSKTFVTLAALVAVREGAVALDEPVATYWKAYGNHGKESTTLRQILTHRAGRPRFPAEAADLDLLDDTGLRDSLARTAPEYVPGTSLGEHALTCGHLVDGILRAAAGTTLGAMFNDVVRPALGRWTASPTSSTRTPTGPSACPPRPGCGSPAVPWTRSGPSPGPLLTSQVTGHDEVFGTRITWTLGLIRDKGKIAKGGIGDSAAWWSLRHGHACAYLTRRLDDHARAAQIATALGDDLTVVGVD